MPHPMLSVLVVNWNTEKLLRACLASIHAHPPSDAYEIVVVDNASADNSAAMVRDEFPAVTLVEPGRNTGYASGNNLAFSHAKGAFLLTLNPDTEVFPDTFTESLQYIAYNPRVGAVGARLVGLDGKTQRSIRGFPTLAGIVGDVLGLSNAFPKSRLGSYRLPAFDYETPGPAPQPMGTFLLFRREALADVGDPGSPFDPAFPIFFNEVDLLLRLSRAGWRCDYVPSVRVLHHGGESTKQARKSMIWESHLSLVRFLRKHAKSGAERIAISFSAPLVYAAAFVRAKGYDPGFRA